MLLRIFTLTMLLFGLQQINAQSVQDVMVAAHSASSAMNQQSLLSNNSALNGIQNRGLHSRRIHSHGDSKRFSVTLNYRLGNGYASLENDSDIYNYLEENAVSLNLRLFNIDHWAFRIGAGYRNIDYQINNEGLFVDYKGFRRDYTILLGLEKHFSLGNAFDIYPGIVVPISYMGEEEVDLDFAENIDNGAFTASVGVLLGANVRIFRILRVGVECTATYDEFKQKVLANIPNSTTDIQLRNIHYYTDFTVGLAF